MQEMTLCEIIETWLTQYWL